MPVLKAELNTSAIDDLINQVVQYKTKVEQMGNKLESRLAEIGVIEIQNNLSAISDVDGNAVGVVGIEKQADKTVVYNKGEQMAYLEYGTGIEGKNNSHPKANKASWQYDTGRVIHTTKSGTRVWHYFDKLKGHHRISSGIPAQMQVLKASIKIRGRIKLVSRELLK